MIAHVDPPRRDLPRCPSCPSKDYRDSVPSSSSSTKESQKRQMATRGKSHNSWLAALGRTPIGAHRMPCPLSPPPSLSIISVASFGNKNQTNAPPPSLPPSPLYSSSLCYMSVLMFPLVVLPYSPLYLYKHSRRPPPDTHQLHPAARAGGRAEEGFRAADVSRVLTGWLALPTRRTARRTIILFGLHGRRRPVNMVSGQHLASDSSLGHGNTTALYPRASQRGSRF